MLLQIAHTINQEIRENRSRIEYRPSKYKYFKSITCSQENLGK